MNDTLAKQPFCYATAQSDETLNLDDLAEHMSAHNSIYSRGVVKGVLTDLVSCLTHLIKDNKRVQLGEIGTFYAKINSHSYKLDNRGNKQQITSAGDFTDNQIDSAVVRFQPGVGCRLKEVSFMRVLSQRAVAEKAKTEYEKTKVEGGTSLS